MYKEIIVQAIHNQNMLRISLRKETDDSFVERDIAPYDVFPKEDLKSRFQRDMLLGWDEGGFNHRSHVTTIYLDNIQNISVLSENFDGDMIQRLINPKQVPNISRNW